MKDERTEVQKLAFMLRYCAERGVITGLHPEEVRRAADRLEELEAANQQMSAALAANEHRVTLDPVADWKCGTFDIGVTMAIISPRMYQVIERVDERMVIEHPDYLLHHLPRKLTQACTHEWQRELEEKTALAISKVDFRKLADEARKVA